MEYKEIIERAEKIARKPVRNIQQDKLTEVYKEFEKKTQISAKLFKDAQNILPQGSEHTLPIKTPYPLFMEKGNGSHIWDVDGNEFIDYILSGGAILLGHNNENMNNSIINIIKNKTNFHGFYDEFELKAGNKIIEHFPSIERVRFTSSGAEANLAAARIARAYTGKTKIIKFRGNYHGWGDQFMTDMEIPGSERYIATGIPSEFLDHTILVYQNDLNALEEIFRDSVNKGNIAAVICEPLGAESGLIPFEQGFHKKAIEIAHQYGALYIFDEVVTGLRIGLGGAQKLLDVQPDITTLGKALMNGYPSCGAVCGKSEILDITSTGLPKSKSYAYIAGTLSGNILSVAAAYHNILELEKPRVLQHLFDMAEDYVNKLNNMFNEKKVDFFAYNYGGIIRIELTAPHAVPIITQESLQEIIMRRKVLDEYALVVHNKGILSRMGRDMISCAHNKKDNNKAVEAYEEMIDILG